MLRSGGRQQQQPNPEQEKQMREVLQNIREFKMKPREVKTFLDRFVVEQDDAKKVLSVAVCDHYNWARRCLADSSLRGRNYTKPNILISGPTGSGKTYLVRTMAKMLGVPFVKADATKFSETGIVGEDAEDVIRSLVDAAGSSSEVAQYGMVYVDEVDKVCSGGASRGVRGGWSGSQVQSNFLKIMEDTEVSLKNPIEAQISSMMTGGGSEKSISTKFILFIFSGAFNDMNDSIKARVGSKSIGFLADAEELNTPGPVATPTGDVEKGAVSYLHLAETSDFVQAGLEPEFIGRIPVRVAIRALNANDLFRILTEAEDSVLKQFQNDFLGYGIKLKATEAGLRRVAEMAVTEKTGARALVTVLERVLRDFKFELPSTSCTELELTPELLADPQGCLKAMISSPAFATADVDRWLAEVEKASNVRLEMPKDVVDRIVKECATAQRSAGSILDARLRNTGVIAGFRDIREATDGSVELFTINEAMLDQPEEEMKKWKKGLKTLTPNEPKEAMKEQKE